MTLTLNLVIAETANLVDADSAGNLGFPLTGGRYGLTAHSAAWASGTMTLGKLAGNGTTYVAVATFTSDGYQTKDLPPGIYQITAPSGAAAYLDIVKERYRN